MAADKNIPELLRVFEIVREYRDAELIVCFHFPQKDYLRQCMALADSVEGVRFVQEPSKHALVHWYNAADLFVSTAVSIFETFGRAPVEAMACGTPPVVSAYNGFRDTVAVDSGFLVPTISDEYRKQPDVRCFAETIVEALENRSDLKLKAQKGVAQAQRFDRNYCGRTILQEMEGARKGVYKNSAHRKQVSLDHYPPAIAELWAPLDGADLEGLVLDFIATGKLPITPSSDSAVAYYSSWFSNY